MSRVFVIDDEDDLRGMIVQILRSARYEVDEARDGAEALERLSNSSPDLVLCDIQMPRLDGFGLLKELRKSEQTSDIPFIFITGQTDRASQREAMMLGADDFITKPFLADELISAVELRLKKHSQMEEKIQRRLDEFRKSIDLSLPHEFRTPLTGILGFADMLKSTDGLTLQEAVYIGARIHKSALRLHRIVERMLLFTELESSMASPQRMESLRASSTAVGLAVSQIAEAKGREAQRREDILLSLAEARVAVLESHLMAAFEELLSNALKFSDQGTPVKVSVVESDGWVEVSVQDTGKGMTPEQIQAVGAFVQFDRRQNEQQGIGLGLGIVEKMCRLYAGSLRIEPGIPKGTTVTMRLPVADSGAGTADFSSPTSFLMR